MIYLPSFDTIDKCAASAGNAKGAGGGRSQEEGGTGGTTGHLIQFCVIFKECPHAYAAVFRAPSPATINSCAIVGPCQPNGQTIRKLSEENLQTFRAFIQYYVCLTFIYLLQNRTGECSTHFLHTSTHKEISKKKIQQKKFTNFSKNFWFDSSFQFIVFWASILLTRFRECWTNK